MAQRINNFLINAVMDSKTLTDVKQSLIAEMEQRVQDKILEPTNAALLKKLISNADDDNEATMIAALGTTYKRTGFHFDKRIEKPTSDIKYFKKNERLSFVTDPSKPTHKLIIGDNYEALQNLLIEYKGKIDVIYIDPPYGKDSMGEFAKTNYENAITRDNLLSMLYSRLLLAKQLLSENGAIFCSIDDKNQAYVKCLFDEIFGERNFVGTLPRVTKKSGKDHSDNIAKNHDFVLIYAKNISVALFNGIKTEEAGYDNIDEYVAKRGKYKLNQTLDYNSLWYNPAMDFPIEVDGETYYAGGDKKAYDLRHNGIHDPKDWVWRWSKAKFDFGLKHGFVVFKKSRNGVRIYTKTYLNASIGKKGNSYFIEYKDRETKMGSLTFTDNIFSNDNAKKDIEPIIGGNAFDFPKPVSLIKQILEICSYDKSTVLDFFAGSGTTGHAVLDLNMNDGGNRQFILCQLNEKTDTTPNGIAYDVTSKRLKRIMTGECFDGSKDFKWIEDNEPYGENLDVYEIVSVKNNNSSEGKTPFDVIDETLYGKEEFATLREKVDWICGNFAHAQNSVESDKEWQERIKKM